MNKTIIKLETACFQDHERVNKILGTLDARNFAKLIDAVGLTANPRKSKVGKITDAIQETLDLSPELFRFKSKGLLVSTSGCIELERNRFDLSFEEEQYEGVLDGGHNMLAIGLHLLLKLGEDSKQVGKIKLWDEFIEIWNNQDKSARDELLDDVALDKISVPIEIIYPSKLEVPNFIETVLDISDARNNNDSLSSTTKHEHKKYYEILKKSLDQEINDKVEWKDNTAGKSIKPQDIIAMSLIPLYALQEAGKLPEGSPKINPVSIYSSKSSCVDAYNRIIEQIESIKDEYNIIISKGDPNGEPIPKKKEYWTEFEWCPWREMFDISDCVIIRGGHSSIGNAVSLGKPSIIIPIKGQSEQIQNARRIDELNLGIHMEEDDYSLVENVKSVLNDGKFLKATNNFRKLTSRYNGIEICKEKIQEYIK